MDGLMCPKFVTSLVKRGVYFMLHNKRKKLGSMVRLGNLETDRDERVTGRRRCLLRREEVRKLVNC
jgi:hypothetical protein